jgi:cytochrome P450
LRHPNLHKIGKGIRSVLTEGSSMAGSVSVQQPGGVLNIDLTSQAFQRNPFPILAQVREAGPIVTVKVPLLGKVPLVTTHEAVNEVLKDDATFMRNARNVGRRHIAGMRWWMPRTFRILSQHMLGHDEPDHRRLRKLVDQAFNRQSIEGLRERIGTICDELLAQAPTDASWDLLEAFARPLPLTVICELLGLPEEDRPNFRKWVRALLSVTTRFGIFRMIPGLFRLLGYFRRHFEQCRRHPRPGLMTALVQAEQDGDKLSENELLAMAFLLLVAGHETTVHLISGGVLALLENPEQKALLIGDRSLVASAVEEVLRYVSPVQTTKPLYASRDLELHGRSFRRGDIIVPFLASANADPARFDDPERMDITRSPNPHVAFGTGIHFCLGAQLARVETQVAFEKIFTRFPRLALAVPGSALRYRGTFGLRALTALPVRVE